MKISGSTGELLEGNAPPQIMKNMMYNHGACMQTIILHKSRCTHRSASAHRSGMQTRMSLVRFRETLSHQYTNLAHSWARSSQGGTGRFHRCDCRQLHSCSRTPGDSPAQKSHLDKLKMENDERVILICVYIYLSGKQYSPSPKQSFQEVTGECTHLRFS